MQMCGHPTLSGMINLDSFVTRHTEREEEAEEGRKGANDSRCERGERGEEGGREAIECSEGQREEWPFVILRARGLCQHYKWANATPLEKRS